MFGKPEPQGVETVTYTHPYKGVRGWLLVFCLILTLFAPISNLAQLGAPDIYQAVALMMSGHISPALLVYVLGISAFSVYSGIGLWLVHPGAVKRAKVFLWTALVCGIGAAIAMSVSGRIPPQASVTSVIRSAVFFLVWYAYLENSKRVKATYGLHC